MNTLKQTSKIKIGLTILAISVAAGGLITWQSSSEYMAATIKPARSVLISKGVTAEARPKTSPIAQPKPVTGEPKPTRGSAIVKDIVINKLVDYAGRKVPASLVNIYKDSNLKATVTDVTTNLSKIVLAGDITGTKVESVLRDVFSTASTDTGSFATGLLQKYNLTSVATAILKDPKNLKAIKEEIGNEIENYAKEEINKLANQALGTLFPILGGVQFDFTDMNSKTLKTTLRNAIVNALAQSYLGPQYVALYLAVSTVCPPCMEKAHAELRRFDKKYIQPATDKIADEWDRFEDRLKAESERVGKQISAEWNRLKEHISAEFKRQKEQITAEANRAKERLNAELKRVQDSKVALEITRQLNDIQAEATRSINRASIELQREWNDAISDGKKISKRVGNELNRQVSDAKVELQRFSNKAKDEVIKQASQVSNEAKRVKDRIQSELKRAADKVKAEANRLKEKAKNLANKAKKKLGF